MSLHNKIRRIHQLREYIIPKEQPYTLVFHLDLFTTQEREQFKPLYTKATAKPLREVWGDLTDQELNELEVWIDLHDALERREYSSASIHRQDLQYVRMSVDEQVVVFLALDLNRLPEDCNDPGPYVQEGHCIYHFRRTEHRNIAINHIQYEHITNWTLRDMLRWVRFYQQQGWAVA